MKFWKAKDIVGGVKVPAKIASIAHFTLLAIGEAGWPGVRLKRVGRTDHEFDVHRFELEIELAPGVMLPTYRGCPDNWEQGLEDKAEDLDAIYIDVVEALEACQPLMASITDELHDLRRRARAVIAGWQRVGLPAELLEVRLAPYDQWRGDKVPKALVLLDGIGEDLRREIEEVHVEAHSDLEHALGEYRPTLVERNAARIALSERGASGTIDRLALNAVAHFHDASDFLRGYSKETRRWLPDKTAVHMRDGHVHAGTGVWDGPVDWRGDSLTFVTATALKPTELAAVIGEPVTVLFDHPRTSSTSTGNGRTSGRTTWTSVARLSGCATMSGTASGRSDGSPPVGGFTT